MLQKLRIKALRCLFMSLEFDYPDIHVVVGAKLQLENQHKQQRKRSGTYVPKSYYARKVLPVLNKA